MRDTNRRGEGGIRACYVCDPGSELPRGGRENKNGEDKYVNGMEKIYIEENSAPVVQGYQ